MVKSALILAGGLGTRLRSVVPDLPKPMAPILERPFLAHQIDYWMAQGIEHFVLSVGYRREVIEAYFGNSYRGARIDYAVEQSPLGTGGGVLLGAAMLPPGERFLLLNGDTYFAVDLARLAAYAAEHDTDWCFSLFRANEAGRYMGMGVEADGAISALRSGQEYPGRLANGGVYLVHPRSLAAMPFAAGDKFSLEDDFFAAAHAAGQRFYGVAFDGAFIDIGVPHDYQRAAAVLTA